VDEYFEKFGYPPFYDSEEEYAMPSEIELKAMNDHDLLVMSVMQGNETVKNLERLNGSVRRRITVLETVTTRPINLTKKQAAGIGSTVFIIGGFLTGVVNALGKIWGLW